MALHSLRFTIVSAVVAVVVLAGHANAQLRVVAWNISNYGGGRTADLQTSIYGVYDGRSMSPDVILGEEFTSAAAVAEFVTILNGAAGSPGDWAAATFVNGPDTDSAFFYRTSRVSLATDLSPNGVTIVATGGTSPNHPRNIMRYDVRLVGYTSAGATLACYGTHMKSGSSSDDQARRLLEAQRVRDNAEVLPTGWNFVIGGDFNVQSSSQTAYQELVGSQANNAGRFFDPINTPGSWNNNSSFRFVHTQDPTGAGGMDDRHDQLLISGGLVDGGGFEYVGNPAIAYSTTTWNDPNHSYRAWGNDGTSYDATLTVTGNTMVGATIAQALCNVATAAGGHLPVLLDLRVPPEIDADLAIEFGQVAQGATAERMVTVTNAGDVGLWGANGVANLSYTLAASAHFSAPAGPFVEAAGGGSGQQVVTLDTSTPGEFNGTLTITSNAPDQPVRYVSLHGIVVVPPCPGDIECDGDVDLDDYAALAGCLSGPFGGPGFVTPSTTCLDYFDFDADDDVDLADFGEFQGVFGQ